MKKGFTLVELLGTITILGVIMLIVTPIARNIIKESKEELYEVQVSNIEDALKNWVVDNSRLLPENEGETITITLGQLKAGGYVEAELRNPKNNKCFGNDMLLTVTRHQKNYIYNVEDESSTETTTCDEYLKPYIILNGDAIVYVEVGEEYVDLGASAIGTDGADISPNITTSISGTSDTIDTSVVGNSYTITYTVTEGSNTTSIKRKVIVNDTTPPELTIPENIVLEAGVTSLNLMEGVSVTDNSDSSGSSVNITAKSNISFGIPGEYIITYIATDSSGNKTVKKRKVTGMPTYDIIYKGITNDGYPTKIIKGEDLEVKFNNPPSSLVVYIDGVKDNSKYTYENGILKINEVTGNITIEYKEKVYLTSLPQDTYFKESAYLTNIKTVSFVDYIDIPSDRLVTYDLSKDGDNSIIGWVDKDYNLYIGSDFKIYATDLTDAFRGMSGVTNIAFNNLDTSENTTLYHTFDGMSNLITLDVSSFDTSNVTNMSTVFQNCSKITSLDLSNWNTSKVTVMHVMFMGMTNLKNLNISSFDTSNVERMYFMFQDCTSLTTLDLSNFNTSNVKEMHGMFQNMSKLTILNLSNFDTSKVDSMNRMFQGMSSLTNLNISSFNTSNVTMMYSMFSDCTSLTTLDLSNFDTSKVTDMQKMFRNNSKLTTLDFRNANFSNVTSYTDMFLNVQPNTNIIVKDSTQQSWIKGKFANLTNVTIAN